eukprot:Seg2177.4 transcript_id=Seg2177.4/GoldUCD/mRNA.D3Y31 product="3-hydroxyisobutyrate dehydrogenase mitochondrial" protein_id=Seg2177.4/GoldUCD/D3Y31
MIDSSTIDPTVSKEVAKMSSTKGAVYMDAPVSGGVIAARDGTLTFMVGGEEESFPKAEEILKHMGKNVVHCGAVGTGQENCFDIHSTEIIQTRTSLLPFDLSNVSHDEMVPH